MKLFRCLPALALAIASPVLFAQTPAAAKTQAAPAAKPAASSTAKPSAAPAAKPVTPAASAYSEKNPLDINTATPDQLMTLPGIGQAYAKRIVEGRPYAAKNQLTSRGIVPQKTYDGVSSMIIAKQKK